MQRILFKKIELWLLLLVVPVGCLILIGFGAIVLDAAGGSYRFGPLSRAAIGLAEIPRTLHLLAVQRRALVTVNWERFVPEPPGWVFTQGAAPLPGYLLLSRYDGDRRQHVVELVSLTDGAVLHGWHPTAEYLFADAPRTSELADITKWDSAHARFIHPVPLPDGSLIVKDHETYPLRVDACGRKLWLNDRYLVHHSSELDAARHIWMPGLLEPPSVDAVEPGWREDALLEFDSDGNLLSERSLAQILLRHGMEWALFNASNRTGDPTHLNDIQPVLRDGPYWKKGDLLLSMRSLSMLMLYRPATDAIVWQKQGPWLAQHDVDILDDHRIAVFDNHVHDRGLGARVEGANRVLIYDFRDGSVTGPWNAALAELGVKTLSEGLFSVLPDGTLMVEEENSGRILFLDARGALLARFINKAPNGKTYRLGWSRWIDPAQGDALLKAVKAQACPG